MSLADTLTKTMNTREIQELIAEAFLLRDTSLVRLDEILEERKRLLSRVGGVFIDIDKSIEAKKLGLKMKVALIAAVQQRISSHLCNNEILLPMGNDEFLIVFPDIISRTALEEQAEVIRTIVMNEPFQIDSIDGSSFSTTVSCGLALFPDDASTAPDLLQQGRNGVSLAKVRGRNRFAWASEEQSSLVEVQVPNLLLERLNGLASDLGRSLDGLACEAFDLLVKRYHR